MVPDARVAWTAMNPEDRPINFTIPLGGEEKKRKGRRGEGTG